ncbi:MAG: hypothetical protein PHG24_00395 [Candidatus Pacebacteria bacterium]|nr:hypothetical protein [Candidatus Paceibacterota bacterium]
MNQIKLINLVVSFLILLGIITFINLKTENSLASLYKAFNPCNIENIDHCDSEELKKIINTVLK